MGKKMFTPQQIRAKFRRMEVLVSQGQNNTAGEPESQILTIRSR